MLCADFRKFIAIQIWSTRYNKVSAGKSCRQVGDEQLEHQNEWIPSGNSFNDMYIFLIRQAPLFFAVVCSVPDDLGIL